jgi:hypothetical protein
MVRIQVGIWCWLEVVFEAVVVGMHCSIIGCGRRIRCHDQGACMRLVLLERMSGAAVGTGRE